VERKGPQVSTKRPTNEDEKEEEEELLSSKVVVVSLASLNRLALHARTRLSKELLPLLKTAQLPWEK